MCSPGSSGFTFVATADASEVDRARDSGSGDGDRKLLVPPLIAKDDDEVRRDMDGGTAKLFDASRFSDKGLGDCEGGASKDDDA